MKGRVIAIALVLAVLGTACADDEPEGIDREAFISQAVAVCRETAAEIDAERQRVIDEEGDAREFAVFASGKVVEQIDDIRGIGLPDDQRDELEGALSTYEAMFTKWEQNPDTIGEGADDPAFLAAAAFLEEYGLEGCGTEV